MEYFRVRFLAAGTHGRHDEVEVVQEPVREKGPLQSLVEVGHDAELDASVTQRLPGTNQSIIGGPVHNVLLAIKPRGAISY